MLRHAGHLHLDPQVHLPRRAAGLGRGDRADARAGDGAAGLGPLQPSAGTTPRRCAAGASGSRPAPPRSAALGFDETFRRMWSLYLAYSEAGFPHRLPRRRAAHPDQARALNSPASSAPLDTVWRDRRPRPRRRDPLRRRATSPAAFASRRHSAVSRSLLLQLSGRRGADDAAAAVLPGSSRRRASALFGVLGGVAGLVGVFVMYSLMTVAPMNVISPVTAVLAAIVPVVVRRAASASGRDVAAWFGIALGLVAVVLVSRTTEDHPHGRIGAARPRCWPSSVRPRLRRVLRLPRPAPATHSGLWPLVVSRVASALLIVPWPFAQAARSPMLRGRMLGVALIAGACDALANMCFLLATRAGLLSLASVLTSLYPAVDGDPGRGAAARAHQPGPAGRAGAGRRGRRADHRLTGLVHRPPPRALRRARRPAMRTVRRGRNQAGTSVSSISTAATQYVWAKAWPAGRRPSRTALAPPIFAAMLGSCAEAIAGTASGEALQVVGEDHRDDRDADRAGDLLADVEQRRAAGDLVRRSASSARDGEHRHHRRAHARGP